jgi:UDPglucose 6-dehydrogenase
VALLGLSFKPGTDNVAGAPALALARRLLDAGATVVGYDPHAGYAAAAALPGLEVADDPYRALEGAHCAVLCTEWEELLGLDPERIRGAMAEPVVVDGRNALDGDLLAKAGFRYLPTGRPARP